jgi:hypothetical protein
MNEDELKANWSLLFRIFHISLQILIFFCTETWYIICKEGWSSSCFNLLVLSQKAHNRERLSSVLSKHSTWFSCHVSLFAEIQFFASPLAIPTHIHTHTKMFIECKIYSSIRLFVLRTLFGTKINKNLWLSAKEQFSHLYRILCHTRLNWHKICLLLFPTRLSNNTLHLRHIISICSRTHFLALINK